ncbi:MAG TPA: FKBP-type peptidyl-prolyl cis-trans isomerase [Phycisphaerae bacterium]|mgnify:CR=1 FL=1|nr:FKBP-type peptidyl-prolyl cis-trans isomerase [Phycisphaerales bacterium]HRX84964.1 FKBP-type peptidyl-prolyl cis-trans isomerase [Phycisphaerae bacterium]
MRISPRLLLVALTWALFTSAGCFEVADLVRSVGASANNPDTPPTDTSSSATGGDQYGPFPPDSATPGGDTDSDGDSDVDTNGDSDTANDSGEPTLDPLPAGAEVQTLDSGLGVYDFEVGTGDQPQSRSDAVRVDYAGYIQDTGRQFDSGNDVRFTLTGVISGFAEGILGMKVGGKRRIIIPPDLGYGASGNAGAGIGGEDVIVFDVTLLSVE